MTGRTKKELREGVLGLRFGVDGFRVFFGGSAANPSNPKATKPRCIFRGKGFNYNKLGKALTNPLQTRRKAFIDHVALILGPQ